jgi:hypothetical protein
VKIRKLPEGTAAQIPPVHLAWQGDEVSLPLKFSSHSGQFDVDLYVLSKNSLPADQFSDWHFRRVGAVAVAGSAVERILEKLAGKHASITRYHARALNSPGHEVTRLTCDPGIDMRRLR